MSLPPCLPPAMPSEGFLLYLPHQYTSIWRFCHGLKAATAVGKEEEECVSFFFPINARFGPITPLPAAACDSARSAHSLSCRAGIAALPCSLARERWCCTALSPALRPTGRRS